MAHESFEDEEVARLLNDSFVSIKVDREERPDLDNIYMAACQMLTGTGGWPLTIIMTPGKKPFFAGTYIPRENRFGRVGLMDLLPNVMDIWKQRREEVIDSSREIIEAMKQASFLKPGKELGVNLLDQAYRDISKNYDRCNGGFGNAPKFPTPHKLSYLLRYWRRGEELQALRMVEHTLQAIRQGGIYDQIGGGVHRYATDNQWRLPHFEKMLYDQALLTITLTEAYQATNDPQYKTSADEIIRYVIRDLKSPMGVFYSAEDADSEGKEGKFYLWTLSEIDDVLSPEDSQLAAQIYNLSEEGNFTGESAGSRTGENILYFRSSLPELAIKLGFSPEKLSGDLNRINQKLFEKRVRRVRPGRDEKILTDWNGLMISAMAKAGGAFNKGEYTEIAMRAADFILTDMRSDDGFLYHSYKEGPSSIPGFLEDYAFFIWALLEIYQSSFRLFYLKAALELNELVLKYFRDSENGGFFQSASNSENLPVRRKELYDGALPSGNSVTFLNLLKLSKITGRTDLEERAAQMEKTFSEPIRKNPSAYCMFLSGLDFTRGESREAVISGDYDSEGFTLMSQVLRQKYLPNMVLIHRPCLDLNPFETSPKLPEIVSIADYTRYLIPLKGKATAYICQNNQCDLPTTDPDKMLDFLGLPE